MTVKKTIEFLIILVLLAVWIYVGRGKLAAFFYNRGHDYYGRHLYDEAAVSFKGSLRVNPNVAVTHFSLANTYMERKMEDRAIEEYEKTIQLDPHYIQAYLALSQIYRSRELYEEALSQLKQAELIGPPQQKVKKLFNDTSFEYMADCLDKGTDSFLAGDKQKAHALLHKALEIRPDFVFAHYTLAYFYFRDSNYDESEKRLNTALQIDLGFWPAHKLLGDIYFERGSYEKALNEYKTALNLSPTNSTLHNNLGLVLMQMERYEEALIYLKEAVRLEPDNLNILYSLASVYRDNGMPGEAVSEYKKLIQHQPDFPNIHNDLGDIYRQQGKNKESLEGYNKEIDYCQAKLIANPDDPIILNNLAYALGGIGEHNRAKEIIEKVIKSYPNYRQPYLTLAKIQEKSGNFSKAIAALEKAKTLSTQTNFIDRDVTRIKRELASFTTTFISTDTVYLKNGRQIKGRIKEEDAEKVIMEVKLGNVIGSLTFYRDSVERIIISTKD